METNTELKMIHLSEVESQQIKWLWYPFIPYGKLSIVQGDPGDGKSTLILNIAAKLSRGEHIDENMNITEPVNVIYQTAEDGLADTVKPRLEAANLPSKRIVTYLPMCKAEIEKYQESQEEYWAREVVWAVNYIITEGNRLNWKQIRNLTNMRKQDLIKCVPYLLNYTDSDTVEEIKMLI